MLQHPLWFALYLGVPINHSRDQPAPSISLFTGVLKAQLGDSSHLPPQPPQQVLQSVDTSEMTAGRDFSSFSAGSGGCHHFEMIWEYKGSRALWERGLPPTTLGVHACSTAKGGWSWHNWRHRELEGVTQPSALRPSLLHSFPILDPVFQRAEWRVGLK